MASWHETHQTVVHTWMCDHYGHMNVRYYAHLFDDASFVLWPKAGVTRAMMDAAGVHMVVAKTETNFVAELVAGTPVVVVSRFERVGTKSVSYAQELRALETGVVHARQSAVEVCFDPETRASRALPDDVRAVLEASVAG